MLKLVVNVFFSDNVRYTVLFMVVCSWVLACSPEKGGKQISAVPEVEISAAVMPAMAPGQGVGAIYLSLRNNTADALVINFIESSVSDHIEVHRNFYEEGVMKMRPVTHVRVEPNGKMLFNPGGYHLMVFNISQSLGEGDTFPLTIRFDNGKAVTGTVEVKRIAL